MVAYTTTSPLPGAPALLCGEYTVRFIGAPGGPGWAGSNKTITLPPRSHSGRWGGRLNNTAGAEVSVDCCQYPEILDVLDWAHYLEVTRSGYVRPLFYGPVTGAREAEATLDPATGAALTDVELITIEAADPTAWWYEVGLDNDYTVIGVLDASVIFSDLHAISESKNTSGLTLQLNASGQATEARFMSREGRYVGDYIDSITGHSIDWTVKGRLLIAGAFAVPLGQVAVAADGWVTKPSARRIGREMSSVVEAFGRHDTHQAVPAVGAVDPVYGRHESYLVDDDIEDDATARRLADSAYRHERRPPIYQTAGSGGLNENAGIGFDDLVCGRLFSISSGVKLEPRTIVKRLHEFDVVWTDGLETAVLPRFEPVGYQ